MYSDSDVLGNAGKRTAGGSELLTRYDHAGRILGVDAETSCGIEVPLTWYTYGTQNTPGNRALGKLTSTTSLNYYDGVEGYCDGTKMSGGIFSDGFEDGTTNAWSMTFTTDGIHDVHWTDGSSMQRPAGIRARRAGAFPWDPGAYQFDGAGNVTSIGAQTFTYDGGNRLVQSQAGDGSGVVTQTYGYDGFGNLVSITDSNGTRTFPADLATNRLAAAAYDAAGNLTSWGGFSYQWRPTGELRTRTGTGLNTWFAYDAGGERVVVHDRLSGGMTFTIRDLGGKVLRVFGKDAGGSWSWEKDSVYRDGLLLAAKDPAGTVHFTLDHLGTPRWVTDAAGNEVARHSYFGFGEEATSAWRDEAMKFTGHERDLEGTPDRLDDLDYMHARYHNPLLGRFLSVDPIGGSIGSSQSFNRYAYVGNSPLNYVDPFGLARLVADSDGAYHFEDEIEVNADALADEPQGRTSQNGRTWLRRAMAATSSFGGPGSRGGASGLQNWTPGHGVIAKPVVKYSKHHLGLSGRSDLGDTASTALNGVFLLKSLSYVRGASAVVKAEAYTQAMIVAAGGSGEAIATGFLHSGLGTVPAVLLVAGSTWTGVEIGTVIRHHVIPLEGNHWIGNRLAVATDYWGVSEPILAAERFFDKF